MSKTTTRAHTRATKTTADAATNTTEPDTRPKYERVADDLRSQINHGQLPPAALLPSEAQLSELYGVSRVTARNAIAALRRQGIVTVIKGKGAFVRRAGDRPEHTDTRTITRTTDACATDARKAGYSDDDTDAPLWRETEKPTTYRVNATPTLALAIGVAEHTPVLGCDRLLEDPAGRRILHRTYIPLPTVADTPALQDNPFIPAGRLSTILAGHGHTLTWTEYVTARNPTPDDTNTLRVPDGTPVLTTRRITRNQHNQALTMEETHRSADNTQLAFTIASSSET